MSRAIEEVIASVFQVQAHRLPANSDRGELHLRLRMKSLMDSVAHIFNMSGICGNSNYRTRYEGGG